MIREKPAGQIFTGISVAIHRVSFARLSLQAPSQSSLLTDLHTSPHSKVALQNDQLQHRPEKHSH